MNTSDAHGSSFLGGNWTTDFVIHIYNHEDDVPSQLLPQSLCGKSCTWAHDRPIVQIVGTNEPNNAQQAKQGA